MTNSFETDISNANFNSAQYYVDDDGSFKFISPILASSNFDGSIPIFEGEINAEDLNTGMLIKLEDDQFYGILSIFKDDPDLEDSPSTDITIEYLDSNNEAQRRTYDFLDTVTVRYEDWEEKYLGTQGWALTYGGNAIFANVGVRGDLEATTLDVGGANGITYDGSTVTIGTDVNILGGITIGDVEDYLQSASYTTESDLDEFITGPEVNTNVTSISGGVITSGRIKSSGYNGPVSGGGSFSTIGSQLNLDDGTFVSPGVRIDNSGNAFFTGTITGSTISGTVLTTPSLSSGTIRVGETFPFGGLNYSAIDFNNSWYIYNILPSSLNLLVIDAPGVSGARVDFGTTVLFNRDAIVQSGYSFNGSGAGLSSLNGSNISTGTVAAARIADLDASKITTGTLGAARIPDLAASKITSGTFDAARIPTPVTRATYANSLDSDQTGGAQIRGTAVSIQSISSAAGTTLVRDSNNTLKLSSSSRKYKENIIEEIIDPSWIDSDLLKVKSFNYIGDSIKQLGLIAEEVNEIEQLQDIVMKNIDGEPESIQYDRIAILLIPIIKEQRNIIEDLQNRVLQLESQLGG